MFQNYDNKAESPGFDFKEDQQPGLLLAGWNHRWAPGSNTLLLLGRLAATQRLSDPAANQLLVTRDSSGLFPDLLEANSFGFDQFTNPALRNSVTQNVDGSLSYSPELLQAIAPYLGSGDPTDIHLTPFDFYTRRDFVIYSAEIQHILQTERNTILLGGRWQQGTIDTDVRMSVDRTKFLGGMETPAADQHVESDYRKASLYAYDYWHALPSLTLIAGLNWDLTKHPDNFRNPPVNDGELNESSFSGKLGFTWSPSSYFTLRGAAAQGVGGLTFDESVRLEPSQIAGFNQSYRTVISESLAGSVEAPEYSIIGLSAEGMLPSRTWWGVSAGLIEQKVSRTLGVFTGYDSGAFLNSPAYFADGTPQRLDYLEENLTATVNQLIGDEFSAGLLWRLTRSKLETRFPELEPLQPELKDCGTLNEISLYGNWISPTGWFAHIEANFYDQNIYDQTAISAAGNGDQFIQFNAWAGYRFNRNLCEIAAGVMNIGDSDYHLSPINPYGEIVRDRTVFVTCRLSF